MQRVANLIAFEKVMRKPSALEAHRRLACGEAAGIEQC